MISAPPPTLTISPPHVSHVVSAGDGARVTVFGGKGTESVAVDLAKVGRSPSGQCEVQPGAAWGWNATPSAFTLKPGQSQVINVRFDKPTATEIAKRTVPVGTQDLVVLASTSAGHHGGVSIAEAVGAQVLVQYPGTTPVGAPKPCLSLSAPTTPSGFPWPLVGALGGLGAVLAGLTTWRLRRRRAPNGAPSDGAL